MLRLGWRCVVAVLLTCAANIANAQLDGHWLMQGAGAFERTESNPASSSDSALAFSYLGYISGTTDVLYVERRFCPPRGTNKRQYGFIVHKYLKEHPEKWSEEAVLLVLAAMQSAFPCK